MSNLSPEQEALQSVITTQATLHKEFARLIVERVTDVMAGNMNALLRIMEQQGTDRQSETQTLTALIEGVSAEMGKLRTGQAEIIARVSDVEERVDELNTRHGAQWEELNGRLKESEADRKRLHEEIEELKADRARRPTPEETAELIAALRRIEAQVFPMQHNNTASESLPNG